jgi:murein DD-endopeptidase MepM/ murein hydrolase activator NlpD
VRAGAHVRQGQVVAYSGSTGESTGPHLHYEVIRNGVKINPKGANAPSGTVLGGRDLIAFRVEKAHIDTLLAAGAKPALTMADVAAVRSRPLEVATR